MEKACTTLEYRIDQAYGLHSKLDAKENLNVTFSLGYGFVSGAAQERLIQPHKTVHTEYLLTSEFTLVAHVASMLGLTLNTSLLDIYHWLMHRAALVWNACLYFIKLIKVKLYENWSSNEGI